MEYELAEDFELKELKNELYKFNEVKKWKQNKKQM
jgi:hypothetical protein